MLLPVMRIFGRSAGALARNGEVRVHRAAPRGVNATATPTSAQSTANRILQAASLNSAESLDASVQMLPACPSF